MGGQSNCEQLLYKMVCILSVLWYTNDELRHAKWDTGSTGSLSISCTHR